MQAHPQAEVGRVGADLALDVDDVGGDEEQPSVRVVERVELPEDEAEIEDLVERLMGKKAEERYRFIQDNARFAVADLDV